ncbi:MAG: PEGA domain-containing protein [Kiritimatiellae bacterium]|nr:PEGA domain-containing protein [Kiritimatiellia bacterium]
MNFRKTAFCILAASALLAGADTAPLRLDVTGRPDGAKVFVDGTLRGSLNNSAPCTVMPLAAGRHLLHVEAPGFRPFDAYVRLDEAAGYVTKAVDLEAEHGIVLLKTTPAGATVTSEGSVAGTTPLLLTSLVCGRKYAFDFTLNGYQRKRVEVAVENRRPIVRSEELVLDSGLITCITKPAGAKVLVDGIERGATPVEVMVPRGGAELVVRLDGYKDVVRRVRMVAGEKQTVSIDMEGLAARLKIVTDPEQAKVYVDGDYRGKSPVELDDVKPGKHDVRVELEGYASSERTVELQNGGEATERFSLANVLGRLEIVTSPPGAKVFVDGKAVGVTGRVGDATRSKILMVEKVVAGEHAVGVQLDGYFDVSLKVEIGAKETKQVFVPLKRSFTPDTEIDLSSGTKVRGVLVQKQTTPQQVVLETRPGVFRTIPRSTIRKIAPFSK